MRRFQLVGVALVATMMAGCGMFGVPTSEQGVPVETVQNSALIGALEAVNDTLQASTDQLRAQAVELRAAGDDASAQFNETMADSASKISDVIGTGLSAATNLSGEAEAISPEVGGSAGATIGSFFGPQGAAIGGLLGSLAWSGYRQYRMGQGNKAVAAALAETIDSVNTVVPAEFRAQLGNFQSGQSRDIVRTMMGRTDAGAKALPKKVRANPALRAATDTHST